jgi:hypothetical protein
MHIFNPVLTEEQASTMQIRLSESALQTRINNQADNAASRSGDL